MGAAALTLKHARVAFTGKLASMGRQEAYRIVREAGGEPLEGVSRRTSMLVVGMDGWPLLADGLISRKLRYAEDLQEKGHGVQILPETAFLELAGLEERRSALQKSYSAQEVSQLLKIEPGTLRRWEQFSLVRSQDGRYDFQDLVSLRTIADLVRAGVRKETIARSLRGLASVLPGTERPLAQLKIVVENPDSLLADYGGFHLSPDGQLLFNFNAQPRAEAAILSLPPGGTAENLTAQEWFARARIREEDERYADAEHAYRRAVALSSHFPEAYFNLGNVLRMVGRVEAAEELYRVATVQDPSLAEAWYNLAGLQEEDGRLVEAIASLSAALRADPSYADAQFNLALCLEKCGRRDEAGAYWSSYLRQDPQGPWAEVARSHLS
jgi:tetratricopeptide (TPR) repeat protein